MKIEKKLKESESAELKKLQEFYKTQENLLNELKIKFEKADGGMKKLKTEMYHKVSYLNDVLNQNEELIFLRELLVLLKYFYFKG